MTTDAEFLTSCSKEQIIEELDLNHQQILKFKGKLFTIMYFDLDYSSEETSGERYAPGDKVFVKRVNRPKKFAGTAIDHNTLSREQLFEAALGD